MATLNVSVTQSNVLLTSAVSSGSTLDFVIDNPIPYTSYFTLETVADNNGFYTNSTSKNTSGSFTLGTGQFGLIQSDYMASVVVPSGSTTLRFIPAVNIPASTLYLRGIGAGPYSTITSFTGLLDTYPGAAAAYSVRLLSSTYAGPAIRVRRSSDNTEQNIGFDSSGNLDTASLLSFCGAGDGFVTTWYDQSGNSLNLTQTNAVYQPKIVNAGVIITQNSKPSIYFDGINDVLNGIALSNYITATTFSNVAVFNPIALTTNSAAMENNDAYWMDGAAGYAGLNFRSNGNLYASVWDGNIKQSFVGITANTQILAFTKLTSGFISISKNNGPFVNAATNQIQVINFNLTIAQSTVFAEINAQELIFYKTDQTSNSNGINTNVNIYYGIY